jgi:S1-C subfamily serine protease
MSGYPRGLQSLNFTTAYIGIRLSPVIQFGRIVSLFPADNPPVPNAFQTDIIGTGGSSDSLIVDAKGNVVGIASEVFGADVMEKGYKPTSYVAKVGPVFGLTTNILKVVADNVADYFSGKGRIPHPFDTTTVHQNFRRL